VISVKELAPLLPSCSNSERKKREKRESTRCCKGLSQKSFIYEWAKEVQD